MIKYVNIFLLLVSISFFSCENFLEPKRENTVDLDQIIELRDFAEGVLLRAYIGLPDDYNFYMDVATDDAVTNDKASSYMRMATGEWKSTYDPTSVWSSAYQQIYYVNKFLEIYESVVWAYDTRNSQYANEYKSELFKKRLKGEAYALRAFYKYLLLQYHGGKAGNGQLLGFPIIDKSLTLDDNLFLPRDTYADCVNSIFNDLDIAIANLPAEYIDKPTGGSNPEENVYYNLTTGASFKNRFSGNAARALKARVALLAASPAFSEGSGVTWEQAAIIAGDLLKDLGDLYTKSATVYNHTFYKEINNKEFIWNRAVVQKRTWEQNNFPPSLFGSGMTNPTQNLVDAFPMKNGYPVTHASSNYDPENPYINRDKRFNEYIVYNNSLLKNTRIYTYIDAPSDGINVLNTSTRTGYYLKKFMAEGVNLNPASPVNTPHTYTLFRMTEVLLNYAEAANEAWGPDADPNGLGFTARSKITELRLRAGIDPDLYIDEITDQANFRNLIRNERRVSLCFEGFRFWDIRRWNDISTMQEKVNGVFINMDEGNTIYNNHVVEERKYEPYMIYGPIPYTETRKYSDLLQNRGW